MTADYILNKKFRGQPVKIQGSRILIEIRTALPQRDTPPSVGLSDALLDYAHKRGLTIYVHVKYPECSFKTTAKEWIKRAKKEEQESYYGIPWFIYRGIIPEIAFMSPKDQEREEYYRFHQR